MVNSPLLKKVVQEQLEKFKSSAKRRLDGSTKGSSASSKSEFTVVDRSNGKKLSYHKPLSKHTYDEKSKKFKPNYEKDFPRGLNTPQSPKHREKQHDYYDGVPTHNKFDALKKDLEVTDSSSDEENRHREYVRQQNSIYM